MYTERRPTRMFRHSSRAFTLIEALLKERVAPSSEAKCHSATHFKRKSLQFLLIQFLGPAALGLGVIDAELVSKNTGKLLFVLGRSHPVDHLVSPRPDEPFDGLEKTKVILVEIIG